MSNSGYKEIMAFVMNGLSYTSVLLALGLFQEGVKRGGSSVVVLDATLCTFNILI